MEKKRIEQEKNKKMFSYQIQLRMDSQKHKYIAIKDAEERAKVNNVFKNEMVYHFKKHEFLENRIGLQQQCLKQKQKINDKTKNTQIKKRDEKK